MVLKKKVIFSPTDKVGEVDLRSLGYYKVKQGVLQQKLSNQYRFESADIVCYQFSRLTNMLKKEEEENGKGKDKYPWLEDSDERKYMTDKEILGKYVNLDQLSFDKKGKERSKRVTL